MSILDEMKAKKPEASVVMGWWNGGRLEILFETAPVEILCYMHKMLGLIIDERLSQLCAGKMKVISFRYEAL